MQYILLQVEEMRDLLMQDVAVPHSCLSLIQLHHYPENALLTLVRLVAAYCCLPKYRALPTAMLPTGVRSRHQHELIALM